MTADRLAQAAEDHLDSLAAYDRNPVPINRDGGTAKRLRETLAAYRSQAPAEAHQDPEDMVLVSVERLRKVFKLAKMAGDNIVAHSKAGKGMTGWLDDACTYADSAGVEIAAMCNAASKAQPKGTEPVASQMPLVLKLRVLADQIKRNDGLRGNAAKDHRTLIEAADALEAQSPAPGDGDVRELRKWLNEQPNRPVDRDVLARLLHAVENAQPVGEIVTDCDGEAVLGDEVSWRAGMPPVGTKLYAAPCAAVMGQTPDHLELFKEASEWAETTKREITPDMVQLLGWLTGAANAWAEKVEAQAATQAPAVAHAVRYTSEMGAAADAYINKLGGRSSTLPSRFRWEECLQTMLAAGPARAAHEKEQS